jgi:phage terminase large subunit
MVDVDNKKIYVFDEMYEKGLSNEKIHSNIVGMGYSKEKITADSAEPKSIDRLRDLGISKIKAARKGKDSVKNGIDYIQDFEIIIHPQCVNFLTEISNYTWDEDKFGKKINKPVDDFNHLMDAMRYALESLIKGESFSFE